MGPMILLVIGIIGAVGLTLYQITANNRFEISSTKDGGVYILDRKSASLNYCNNQRCQLVNGGTLPSQFLNSPSELAIQQNKVYVRQQWSQTAIPALPSVTQTQAQQDSNTNSKQIVVNQEAATPQQQYQSSEQSQPQSQNQSQPQNEPQSQEQQLPQQQEESNNSNEYSSSNVRAATSPVNTPANSYTSTPNQQNVRALENMNSNYASQPKKLGN